MANTTPQGKGALQKVLKQVLVSSLAPAETAQIIVADNLDTVKKYLDLGKKVIQLRWNDNIVAATELQSQFGLDRLRIITPAEKNLLGAICKASSEMAG
jgi:hypothetical protein